MAEKTTEELEEERMMKELTRAKSTAKSNFFAQKKPLGGGAVSPGRSPPAHQPVQTFPKQQSTGSMPEWKRKQLEAEQAAAAQREEEERKKRERANLMGKVEEVSASPFGTTFHEPIRATSSPRHEIDTSATSPRNFAQDQDELLRIEEQRLARKLATTAPAGGISSESLQSPKGGIRNEEDEEELMRIEEMRLMKKTLNTLKDGEQPASPTHATLERAPSVIKCDVLWIDRSSGAVLRQQSFPTVKGKLPVATLKRMWGVNSVTWVERNCELREGSDGYSDLVVDRNSIRVWCQ